MMSSDEAAEICCASCGIAEVDNTKLLKKCGACGLVRYCSIECQRDHRPQHEQECKTRAAELRDELLFKQPENRHEGDCPICFLPLPIDPAKCTLMGCCSKSICNGCDYANQMREEEKGVYPTCAFCRHPVPENFEEAGKNEMKRIEANDPVAIRRKGKKCLSEGDNGSAFEYLTKAAGLGDIDAHFQLSAIHYGGHGVEKDEKNEVHHLEQAAIAGHPAARYNLGLHEYNLGLHEGRKGRIDRAVKHLIIAANLGHDDSMKVLRQMYTDGLIGKGEFAAALRAHHAAVEAAKSPQRETAEAARKKYR